MRFFLALLALTSACSQTRPDTPAADSASQRSATPKDAAEPTVPPTPPPATPAVAELGEAAPDFDLVDLDGKHHKLSSYRGNVVVLEWFNPNCPFVNYAHTDGPLKSMAADETANGVTWLAINSGGPGRQGHGIEANKEGVAKFGLKHPVLLDETGATGHAYDAKFTPHIYLIDADGTLVYRGGIDNAPFGETPRGVDKTNHLREALLDLRAGKPVRTAKTDAYGCSVKYPK